MEGSGSQDDDLFSMEDLEKDLKKGRGARRLPWFAAGLVLGIAGTIVLPSLLEPYLPDVLGGGGEVLSGPVLAEERDGDRLLLTIQTEPGALIASFSQRVSEIDLLVNPGDTVTIIVEDYDPFVEDPDFEGVRKAAVPAAGMPETTEAPATTSDPPGSEGDGDTEPAAEDAADAGETGSEVESAAPPDSGGVAVTGNAG